LAFEIKKRDLMGRIGRIETKSGSIETPLFLPVVNPLVQAIPPRKLWETFGLRAVMTNAYLVKKNFRDRINGRTIHELLDFPGIVMTDSGAYQILTYGEVAVTPSEILAFQEQISTDIGVILDQPTSWRASWTEAKKTVDITLERAEEALKIVSKKNILWTGPVQGGVYLDLVELSARRMSDLPFNLYALGSPTTLMQSYWFGDLVDMIATANSYLPPDRPMHLFGAGHPLLFSFAVALGCDTFDSAAYALYARQGRYMTDQGTLRIDRLEYFPCSCPVCSSLSPKELRDLPAGEREIKLAEHNIYSCTAEIGQIKQAITDGRLWEHLELRSRGHPALLSAFKRFKKYEQLLESRSPVSKRRGLFYFDSTGLSRPEIVRHAKRIELNYKPLSGGLKVLLLVSQPRRRPFHKSPETKRILEELSKRLGTLNDRVHVCFFASPFGIIPMELDEIYPLSQYESAIPCDKETVEFIENQVRDFILRFGNLYRGIVLLNDKEMWGNGLSRKCHASCKRAGVPLLAETKEKSELSREKIVDLSNVIATALSDPYSNRHEG